MQVFLETARLLLRHFTADDVDNLFELDSDSQVMRYLTGGTSSPREVVQNSVLPAILGYYERFPGFGIWAALDKASLHFLGWFSFRSHEAASPYNVEFGYRLRRAA